MRIEERMVTIARPGRLEESLEGIFVAAQKEALRGAVVAPPHPLYGGSMESPVANEIAFACAKAGIASLRFNWRGVGASTGAPSGEAADADADYAAALAHMAETVPGPVVACGYSFGAAAAVRVAAETARIDRLLLVAPPPALLAPERLTRLGRKLLLLVGAEDALAPVAALEAALEGVAGARLAVIPGADHFFAAGLVEVGRLSAEWLGA